MHKQRVSTRHTTRNEVMIRLSDFSVQEETENDLSIGTVTQNFDKESETTIKRVTDFSHTNNSDKRTLES